MKGPEPLHISAPASTCAGPGFRFANNVCEPPAAQSAAQTLDKPIFPVWGCMKGPQPLHIFAPASAYAGPGFRFANNVCEPPAAQSAAFEIRSGGMYAARLEALWASKSASPTADGKIEDFDAAPSERPRWPLPLSFSFSPQPRLRRAGVPVLRGPLGRPRTSSRVNAASDRPSPKVTKEGRALARLATAN